MNLSLQATSPKSTIDNPRSDFVRVCLLGASFDTGNLGVSALAESSVKCILARWADARVTLLGSSRAEGEHHLPLAGAEVVLQKMPVRFCKNILLPEHFCMLASCVVLWRLLPFGFVRRGLSRRNRYFRLLLETDYFIDISAGDSFSDLYGLRRLVQGFLIRSLLLLLGKDFILFPQTYGPFRRRISKALARYILKRAKRIYSRDQAGLEYAQGLLGVGATDARLRFAPDVAFLLDAREPRGADLVDLHRFRSERPVLVGLNVSGLLYYGGYTDRNEFGLKVDYRRLIDDIVAALLKAPEAGVLLVPHVIPRGDFPGSKENDLHACLDVRDRLAQTYPDRLFVVQGDYDQAQIKHIIGLCHFFLGARMHSCIAALSQCIPAIGLAYSKKFRGVFETVGAADLVLDMRSAGVDEIVGAVEKVFASRDAVTERLRRRVPSAQQQVRDLLKDTEL